MLVLGIGVAVAGVWLAGRTSVRTSYRPDPWRAPEWLVSGAGVAAAGTFALAGWLAMPGLATSVDPPAWPQLPLLALAGVLIAMTPALTASPLPLSAVPPPRAPRSPRPTVEVTA
jgi:energy-coupling factor transport system permease protein